MPIFRGDVITAQGAYFFKKLPQYSAAALEIANRVLQFFQYTLLTPLVRPIQSWEHALHNPTWLDGSGAVLSSGTRTTVAEPVPGLWGELGAKSLKPKDAAALTEHVKAPCEPPLALSLLSDAQTAWFEGNLRRSVLELAICAEVMVKRRFFAHSSPAAAAFDYLEDKSRVSVRVLELLDAVAEEVFSRSFRKEEVDNFDRIDYLFRCRNKLAHRAELTFRDNSGKKVQVDKKRVESWWHAVASLKNWLDALP